jgi:phosphoesterase RecJ-like protein
MELHSNTNTFSKAEIVNAYKLISQAHSVTLLTHYQPDGDGVSACAALSAILKKLNKKIEAIFPTQCEMPLKRNPENLLINKHSQIPDLIITCDTANSKLLYFPPEFASIPLINIDHHISNKITGTYNFVDPASSSTCEIITELIEEWDASLFDRYVAECLLTGILYDTQVFQIQSVNAKTLRIAASLIDRGAHLYDLKTELLAHKNPAIIYLWADIMKTITITPSKKAVYAVLRQKDLKKYALSLSSLVGFNNFLSQIVDIDVTLFFYETKEGKTKVSLRSRKTDVNELAAQFGGGGHTHASGILSDRPIDELIQAITRQL